MNRAVGVGFLIGLVLLCDLAVVTVHVLDDHTSLVTAKGAASSGQAGDAVVPGKGQAFVTGDLESLVADGAQLPPLTSPFTITAVERGAGRVAIERALVNDRRATVTWDSGTPLPISGAGGLDLGSTRVEVNKDGPVISLDGAARTFLPGTYSVGTTVAVGSGGLATPQEGVVFTADDQTRLQSKGNVVVHLDPRRLELLGPGKLTINGGLKVQFRTRTVDATSVNFEEGPYRLTVEPGPNALRISAVLQGSVDVR